MKGDGSLDTIQIKNVRSLKDTGVIPLSSITLLVGENSSGKSTFLRIFPLIKQSISKRTDGPILWAGDIDDYVDFGSFSETVTNDSSKSMEFCFTFSTNVFSNPYYKNSIQYEIFRKYLLNAFPRSQVKYSIAVSHADNREYISKLCVIINNSEFTFELQPSYTAGNILVDGCSMAEGSSIPQKDELFISNYGDISGLSIFGFTLPSISAMIDKLNSSFADYPTENTVEKDAYLVHHFQLFNTTVMQLIGVFLCVDIPWEEIKVKLSSTNAKGKTVRSKDISSNFDNIINQLDAMTLEQRKEYFRQFKLIAFYEYFLQIDRYLDAYFRKVHYIAPLRATAERYYRLRNLAIDEVDYQGKNLAIFLSGLSERRIKSFQNWTKEYFGFFVKVEKGGGHLSVKVALNTGGEAVNISDTGFGYSQILPIITQLWDLSTQPQKAKNEEVPLIVAIEQPELHLHPALQAKLAKAFMASIQLAKKNGYRLQLLIETHSETIVNYFGRSIADLKLSSNDISVILFDKELDTRHTKVQISSFDKDGYLNDWPIGFFASGE